VCELFMCDCVCWYAFYFCYTCVIFEYYGVCFWARKPRFLNNCVFFLRIESKSRFVYTVQHVLVSKSCYNTVGVTIQQTSSANEYILEGVVESDTCFRCYCRCECYVVIIVCYGFYFVYV